MGMRLHADSDCMRANRVQLATDAMGVGPGRPWADVLARLIRGELACIPPARVTIRHQPP